MRPIDLRNTNVSRVTSMEIEFHAGTEREQAKAEALAIAATQRCVVYFEFNGERWEVVASPECFFESTGSCDERTR